MFKRKVVVVGFDGASFDVVSSLAKQDLLPNFKRLMDNGSFGVLNSTFPPISPVAWPSLYTGTNPGKHGIFSFLSNANGFAKLHLSSSVRGKALWDILTTAGRRSVLANLPWTFPPYEINGIMISGFPSPGNKVQSYPPEAISLIQSKTGEYTADVNVLKAEYGEVEEEEFLNEISLIITKQVETMCFLLETYEWDLFMQVFTFLDRIQHLFYGCFDEKSRFFDKHKRNVVIEYYQKMDSIIGMLLPRLGKDTILMVVSDHGFGSLDKLVAINNLLAEAGFMGTKKRPSMFTAEKIISLSRRLGLHFGVATRVPKILVSLGLRVFPSKIDFHTSSAYSIHPTCITINPRIARGTREYDNVKKKLTNFLNSIKDDETGEKIVEKIYYKEEIFSGSYIDSAPDLLIVFKSGYEPRGFKDIWVKPIDKPPRGFKRTGTHSGSAEQRGILWVIGEGIKKGHFTNANIVDIAPTILHILGFSIPSCMDGIVLKEVFQEKSDLAIQPIKYSSATVMLRSEEEKKHELSKEDEEDIKKRLQALGYLD